jgi:hypothetical protein
MQHMLRIQIIGLAVVSALAMSAVAAGSASAEIELHQWLINHKLLASSVKIHSLGLLLLADHTPPFGEVVIHCHGLDDGTVGPHGLDLILAITTELLKGSDLVPCKFDPGKTGGCKENVVPKALALNLPWLTHLLLDGGVVRDRILGDGNGAPGWRVVCTSIANTEVKDTCTFEGGGTSVLIRNVEGVGVEGEFDSASLNVECSVNGETPRASAGLVRGTTLFFSPSPTEPLTVSFN